MFNEVNKKTDFCGFLVQNHRFRLSCIPLFIFFLLREKDCVLLFAVMSAENFMSH